MPLKVNVNNGEELDIKRLYIDKCLVDCANCGTTTHFLGDNYLSFPKIGETEKAYGYCGECDTSFSIPIKLGLTIEYHPNNATIED